MISMLTNIATIQNSNYLYEGVHDATNPLLLNWFMSFISQAFLAVEDNVLII
jgi:hypothetical protein